MNKPRVLTMRELQGGFGGGIYESWLPASDGDPEIKETELCGFCCGHFILSDGSNGRIRAENYNRPYGIRIWTAEPSDELREAWPWDAEE